jgi:hypothetical protein
LDLELVKKVKPGLSAAACATISCKIESTSIRCNPVAHPGDFLPFRGFGVAKGEFDPAITPVIENSGDKKSPEGSSMLINNY